MILEKANVADDSSPMFFEKKSFLESVFGDLSKIQDCEINPEWIAGNMKEDGIPFHNVDARRLQGRPDPDPSVRLGRAFDRGEPGRQAVPDR